jgi:hypothetical protein
LIRIKCAQNLKGLPSMQQIKPSQQQLLFWFLCLRVCSLSGSHNQMRLTVPSKKHYCCLTCVRATYGMFFVIKLHGLQIKPEFIVWDENIFLEFSSEFFNFTCYDVKSMLFVIYNYISQNRVGFAIQKTYNYSRTKNSAGWLGLQQTLRYSHKGNCIVLYWRKPAELSSLYTIKKIDSIPSPYSSKTREVVKRKKLKRIIIET